MQRQGILKQLAWFMIVFLVGIVIARYFVFDNELGVIWWLILISCLLCNQKNKLSKLSIFLLIFLLGLWRGSVFAINLKNYNTLLKHKVTIIANIKNDAVYTNNSQLEFDIDNIYLMEPFKKSLAGTIAVKGYGAPMVYKDDLVKVSAKLYPMRGSKQAIMSYSEIEVLKRDESIINNLRRRFVSGLQSSLPEPLSSFGLGLLIGQRNTLPEKINEQLSIVGLTHIVAVSGYNLTIIVQFVLRLSNNRSKYQTTVFTVLLIGLFLLLTGFSASIVRASVVSLLSIWAWFYGRKFRALVILLLSACLTAGFYPIYIWSDIGWYLSFLSFFGILIVGPIISNRFFSNKKTGIIKQLFIETTATQLMTLPLILYIFGKLSIVAILANMLVVPLVSLAMGLTFTSGIFGSVLPQLVGWFSWPTVFVLNYMLDMTKLVSQIPSASMQYKITLQQLIICYLIIFFVNLVWWKKLPLDVKIKI